MTVPPDAMYSRMHWIKMGLLYGADNDSIVVMLPKTYIIKLSLIADTAVDAVQENGGRERSFS